MIYSEKNYDHANTLTRMLMGKKDAKFPFNCLPKEPQWI